ncbi:MAG: Tim44-like domain-containing protein [Eubacteriales bacterium]|nr:Tim44-like domain-containing protein [Eubacteriales bacterium]
MKKKRTGGKSTRWTVSVVLLLIVLLSVGSPSVSARPEPAAGHVMGSAVLYLPGEIADVGNFRGNRSFHSGSSRSSRGSSSRSSGRGSSSSDSLDWFIIGVFGVPGFIIWMLIKGRQGGGDGTVAQSPQPTDSLPLAALQQADPYFSAPALEEKVARLYVEMQTCWANKRWEPMRAHMSAQLYGQLENQLKDMDRQGMTNHIERVAVLRSQIRKYRQDDTNDILTVYLRTRIVDYTTDRTGQVVVGSPTEEVFMEYSWELIRSQGVRTPGPQEKDVQRQTCSGCGAPIDVNHSAKCEYCGSIITAKEYDWVINRMEGISQQTVG